MRRKNENFYKDFVLNIASTQLNKKGSLTDFYCCLSLSKNNKWRIAVIGLIDKNKFEFTVDTDGLFPKKGTDGSITLYEDKEYTKSCN